MSHASLCIFKQVRCTNICILVHDRGNVFRLFARVVSYFFGGAFRGGSLLFAGEHISAAFKTKYTASRDVGYKF